METAIALTVFAFVVAALVGFADIFLKGFTQLVEVRAEAGIEALTAAGGDGLGAQAIILRQSADPKASDWRRGPGSGAYADAWSYPEQAVGQGTALSAWRQTTSPFVCTRAFRIAEFPLELSLLGSGALFPDALVLKETALLPTTGGTR